MPGATPVTMPDEDPTVAIPVLLLLHMPPGVPFVNGSILPTHTLQGLVDDGQGIATGVGHTVIVVTEKQPVPNIYVIVATPAPTPVITPPGLIVATVTGLLLHVPGGMPSGGVAVTVVVEPTHILLLPVIVIAEGFGKTVIREVTKQPVGTNAYDNTVVPRDTPLTNPEDEPTVAIEGVCVLQIPPGVGSVTVIDPPKQTLQPEVGHVIVAGNGFTVNCAVEKPLEPQLYVIVTTPAVRPAVTNPLDDPIVAIAGFELLQVQPPGEQLKVT